MEFNPTSIELFYAGAGLAIGMLLAAAFFVARLMRMERRNGELTAQINAERQALETAATTMDLRFKATAQEALAQSGDQFLKLAQEKLKSAQADSAHDLEKRQNSINELVTPIKKQLEQLGGALEQVKGTDTALREDLKNLSRETSKLVGALRDPAAQGKWGEYILERLLENSGLIKGIHYETQVSMNTAEGRQRPDVVVKLQDGFNIIIDAKAPINEYASRLADDISEEEYKSLMNAMSKQVKSHVQDLSRKGYWENIDSPDFTVLFLPSEYIYSIALRADSGLVDYALANNIIIASPTLLMSLLRVVGLSWRQVELAKNAQDISALGKELYERITTFSGHMDTVGKNIGRAGEAYNKAVSSLESRVLVSARKFEDLHAAPQGKALPEMEPLDQSLKSLETAASKPLSDPPRNISAVQETAKKQGTQEGLHYVK